MMYRSEWVVPYFNDDYRFDKPPLTYWWMRVHFWVFGVNEFAARLHSVVASLLCALAIYGFARRLGLETLRAFYAGAAWLTCLQVLIHSRMAVADLPLILFLVFTMWALWELLQKPPDRGLLRCRWFWILHVSIGLGFLAKGPLAYFIPLLALLLWGGLNRIRKRPSPRFGAILAIFAAGIPISLAIIAAWGIPALLKTEGAFFGVGIGKHVVERGTKSFNDRLFIPVVYYLVAMLPSLLPWSPRIPDVLKTGWKDEGGHGMFLLAWFIAPFLIFGFYATQLPHYILPGYPAFFLLLFLSVDRLPSGRFAKILSGFCSLIPFLALLVLGGGAFAIRRHLGDNASGFWLLVLPLLAVLLALGLAAFAARANKIPAALLFGTIAGLLFIPFSQGARNVHATIRLQRELAGQLTNPATATGFTEPSLVWYFDDGNGYHWKFKRKGLPKTEWITIELRRWRLDDDSLGKLFSDEAIEPSKDRSDHFRELSAAGWVPVTKVTGWSPATSSIVELWALRNPAMAED